MKRFYIDVDTQVDFCHKYGAAYIPKAEKILDNCEKLVNQSVRKNELIIGSVDTHSFDSWEFKTNKNIGPKGENPNKPVHCIKGTNGWLKMNDTSVKRTVFIPNVKLIDDEDWKSIPFRNKLVQAFYFEKEVYSLFANPNASAVLVELLPFGDIKVEYVIFGVGTETCIKETALELKKFVNKECFKGSTVKVVSDAIADIDSSFAKKAIDEMKKSEIEFITTEEFLLNS